ncbi:MAG: hypothetical protein M0R68_01660 [Bacteroidetes bacterium]|nr:hypothetical protein [Bacteroidota bacterium]
MSLDEYFSLCFTLDLNLQPRTSGEYQLFRSVYPQGSIMPIVPTTVQARLWGFEYRTVTMEHDFMLYEIWRGNQCIMSNVGVELFPLYIPYLRAKGHVLLGGLGIGFLAQMLCLKENVVSVTAVEFSPDVIDLCTFSHPKINIVPGDFYAYLKEQNLSRFEYIYFDTFSDGLNHYESTIIPMRKYLIESYPGMPFDFWNEDEMKIEHL